MITRRSFITGASVAAAVVAVRGLGTPAAATKKSGRIGKPKRQVCTCAFHS